MPISRTRCQAATHSVEFREPLRLVVHSVEPGSAAEARGLQVADILHTIDGHEIGDLDTLCGYLDRRPAGAPLRVVFRRSSDSDTRWFDYQVRDLAGASIEVIGPERQLTNATP